MQSVLSGLPKPPGSLPISRLNGDGVGCLVFRTLKGCSFTAAFGSGISQHQSFFLSCSRRVPARTPSSVPRVLHRFHIHPAVVRHLARFRTRWHEYFTDGCRYSKHSAVTSLRLRAYGAAPRSDCQIGPRSRCGSDAGNYVLLFQVIRDCCSRWSLTPIAARRAPYQNSVI